MVNINIFLGQIQDIEKNNIVFLDIKDRFSKTWIS